MHELIIPVLPSPTGIAHYSAMLVHVYCATYDPPRPFLAYAVHYTILAMQYRVKANPRDNILACFFVDRRDCDGWARAQPWGNYSVLERGTSR